MLFGMRSCRSIGAWTPDGQLSNRSCANTILADEPSRWYVLLLLLLFAFAELERGDRKPCPHEAAPILLAVIGLRRPTDLPRAKLWRSILSDQSRIQKAQQKYPRIAAVLHS